jgi:hypothetical protein
MTDFDIDPCDRGAARSTKFAQQSTSQRTIELKNNRR